MGLECPKCKAKNTSDSEFCKRCATPLPSPEEIPFTETLETPTDKLTPGITFAGRYEIIEELGMGGMGRVYRVKDEKLDEEMALKVLKPEIAADKGMIERFKNELKIARKIAHRSICKMYDLNEEEEIPFITMEYVPGEDLKSFIRRKGKLTEKETIAIGKQMCKGLEEAHVLGVIHRDLKPQNIMIDEKSNAKVMDFGIARSVEAPGITHTGMMIGTPDYISPEQAEGEEADQRSDIYSLGVILYEMMTGSVPFKGDTALSVALKHKSQLPKDPRKLNHEVSEDMSRLILVCMEKDRKRRYQKAVELLSDLKNIEDGFPLGTKIRPRRRPTALSLIRIFLPALVMTVLVITALIIWQPWSQKEAVSSPLDLPSLAVMYFENNTGDENLDHWRSALPDLLSSDLAQSKYLRVLPTDRLLQVLKKMKQEEAKRYSTDVLNEIASQEKIKYFILASFAKAGDDFRISLKIRESWTGEQIGTEVVEGKGEESLFNLVDELTPKIKTHLNISSYDIAADFDKDVGDIFTNSPDAMKFYILGKQYYNEGKFKDSNKAFEKAIEIDEGFALAYKRISENYHYLGEIDQAKKYAEQALSLTERISIRDRYLVQGWAYTILDDSNERAIETYKEMLQYYPDDEEGNIYLGAIYRNMEEWDLAFERFDKILELNPLITYQNIVQIYMAKGLYEKALEFLRINQQNYSNQAFFCLDMGLIYLCQGKYNLSLIEIEKSLDLDPENSNSIEKKGRIYYLQDNFQLAEYYYRQLLEHEDPLAQFYGRSFLAHLYLAQGQYENCKNEIIQEIGKNNDNIFLLRFLTYLKLHTEHLEEALEISDHALEIATEIKFEYSTVLTLHLRGLIQLKMNKIDEAKNTADELKSYIEKIRVKKYLRFYHRLMGMIARNENMISLAIEDFEKAISLLSHQYQAFDEHAFFLYPLALSNYQMGEMDEAQNQFESIINLTTGRLQWGNIYAKSFFMLGKIFEKKGDGTKAIEHYNKFLDLWKDADPGIAEVEDAKKRLAALKSQ